jgi:hypothetical protein
MIRITEVVIETKNIILAVNQGSFGCKQCNYRTSSGKKAELIRLSQNEMERNIVIRAETRTEDQNMVSWAVFT